MEAILKIENISKHFNGIKAVNDVSFNINKGTINALIGPNGAGKTTIFNIITNLYNADNGTIHFNDKNLTRLPTHKIFKTGIIRTFQKIRLFPQLTVMENMLLAGEYIKGESLFSAILKSSIMIKEEDININKAENILDECELLDKKNELAKNLSHGQRRLLELSRAIMTDAELYLFDEPSAGLSPTMKRNIIKIIKDLKLKGKTILLIEHNMNFIKEICSNVIVLSSGKKIAEGNYNNVINNPDVISAYLDRNSK